MPSYMHTKDIKPEDLKPDKEPELTKKEKIKNWLYYMKWPIIGIAAAVIFAVSFIVSIVTQVKPDISIGIVAPYTMPNGFVEKLQSELEGIIDDYNGDGKISVSIETFSISSPSSESEDVDPQLVMAETTRLASVHQVGNPVIFLLEASSAEYYQESYALIGNWDGTFYEDGERIAQKGQKWNESEFLTNLDLVFEMNDVEVSSLQDVIGEFYVGVMPLWEKQFKDEKLYGTWENNRDFAASWFNQ